MTACRKMICGLAGLAALAASAGTPVLTVPETAQPPAIDGRVEPGEWRDALEITGFQLANGQGRAKEETRVFLKYDRDHLYVAAIASDGNTKILNRGGAYDDCIEIFVMTPFNRNIYHWLLYSRGTAGLNYVDEEYGGMDRQPPVAAACKATVNDGSWMVEAALPAAGYDLTGIFRSPGWKISCHRSFNHNQTAKEDGRGPEFSGFAPIPGQFQKPLEFPELKLGGKGTIPVRMTKFSEREFRIAASPAAELRMTVDGGKAVTVPNRNGVFESAVPAGTRTLELLLTDGAEVVFANRWNFPADPAPARRELREKQMATRGLGISAAGSFERIFSDLPYFGDRREFSLEAARNEFENFQLVLFTGRDAVDGITVEASELRSGKGGVIPAAAFRISREGSATALPVGYPTVRGAGDYPDPLFPLTGKLSLKPGEVRPLWISLKVPMEAAPGNYIGSIRVADGSGRTETVAVKLEVYPFAIPKKHSLKTAFSIWETSLRRRFFPDEETMDVAKFTALVDRYAMMLVEHRLTPIIFGVPALLPKRVVDTSGQSFEMQPDGSCEVKAEVYDALNKKYLEAGAAGFCTGPYLWHFMTEDHEVPAEWPAVWRAVNRHYAENGMAKHAFAYPVDEPGNGLNDKVRKMTGVIRENAPDLKILVTGVNANFPSRLVDNIDCWVPALHWTNLKRKAEEQAAGREVWQYPCSGPWYPWPNYHLDTDASAWRAVAWVTAKEKFDGILYWATAIFNPDDPFVNNANGVNGDGVLQYPAGDGSPLASIRLKVICDGMEDYEYMVLLKNAVAEAKQAKKAPALIAEAEELQKLDTVFRTMDDYSRNEADYRTFRRRAAELIGKLER